MLKIALKSDVVEQIEQWAAASKMSTESVVEEALRNYLTQRRREKIHTEMVAFQKQLATLLVNYADQYIAMHNGHVIDHDPDLRVLHLRIFAKLGRTPVLLKRVTTEPEQDLVFRSPRLE